MAFPGELKGFDGTVCLNCGAELDLGVYKSAAGYYLGYWCVCCGPYSRETGYYPDRDSADVELDRVRRGLLPNNVRVIPTCGH